MNLEKHIDAAASLYKGTYKELDNWERAKQQEEKALKERSYKLTREAANDEHTAFVKKYNDMRDNIISAHKMELDKIEQAYLQEVEEFYQPDGTVIDKGDQGLLYSGILKPEEIAKMVVKHKDNTTMLRIISQSMKDDSIDIESMPTAIRRALYYAEKAGEKERLVFSKFNQLMATPIRMAASGLAGTEAFMNSMLNADEYVERAKNDLVKAKIFITEEDQAAIDEYEAKSKNFQVLK